MPRKNRDWQNATWHWEFELMRKAVLAAIISLISLAGLFMSAGAAEPNLPEVTAVRFAGAGEVTRIIVETNRPVRASSGFVLEENAHGLLISLPSLYWNIDGVPRSSGVGEGFGLVSGFRYGYARPDAARLALDLSGPVKVIREISLPPAGGQPSWRYTLDIMPGDADSFARQAARDRPRLASLSPVAEAPVLPERTTGIAQPGATASDLNAFSAIAGKRHVIVIDPGHGGRDPGAVTKGGLMEKDVNLKTALALKALLSQNPRFDVRLTRETDVFIELEDRVKLARDWGAELFISIHADAAKDSSARGGSVYTLSERGAKRSKRLVESQNWVLPLGADEETSEEVVDILSDFLERETKTNSETFATLLIGEMSNAGPMLRNSHRNAGFVVLFAPDVPAVLVELGFLTNPSDERRLASSEGRQRAAAAIGKAITAYFMAQDARYADR